MKELLKRAKLLSLLCLLFSVSTFAQVGVGKLAGKIIDADTKEPLIGTNIVILNTSLGAASDANGNYFVLNITPGTYNIQVSYVGYGTKVIKDIRIVAGITYELNVELNSGVNLSEVVITDKRFFEEKATNTVKVVDATDIAKLPVRGVERVAAMQSGVVMKDNSGGVDGNATINVRGGRGNEVLFIVDGIPQNDVLAGTSDAQVSNSAVEQISFQVGGYEAKYGQAQSGIVNVTTKSGSPNYTAFADVMSSTFTDDYGFNLYTLNFGGPIIPGNPNHTFFLSGERGWYLDADPSAISIEFPTTGYSSKVHPNNSASNWRFTGRTYHSMGDFTLRLGANLNYRENNVYIHQYAKNNADFMPKQNNNNLSFSARLSQTINSSTFWTLTAGYKYNYFEQYNPYFKDNLMLYGDSLAKANIGIIGATNGQNLLYDNNSVFYKHGRVQNLYNKTENGAYTLDFDFTSQIKNHLLEVGGGASYTIVRYYYINPIALRTASDLSEEELYASLQPSVYGYDITGKSKTSLNYADKDLRPKTPIFAYAYIQDRYELEDLVLNLGLRLDYFDTQADVLKNPSLPYAGGSDPANFDSGDFKKKDAEVKISPRIGLAFPITESTVFHAQVGKFIQQPALTDLYTGKYDLIVFKTMAPQYVIDGRIKSEETTQYEVGFRQAFGNTAAINLTAFYKNIKGLVNRTNNYFQRTAGGELITYIAPNNSDFGTTKGFAFSLDLQRINFFDVSVQYTYSVAEGTGSSTSSSQTAIFRNTDNSAPKVIAPLDFDQRHTGVVNVNFYIPKGEMGVFEMLNANLLISLASGRPYTPLDYYDILSGNDGGPSTTGYVNSRYSPGTFRVDLKLEKSFSIGKMLITPYVWIDNLFDAKNIVNVYRSTGDAYSTGYLNTSLGKANVANNGKGYEQDYISLERDPGNFGIPRLIKLGLKVNFSNIEL